MFVFFNIIKNGFLFYRKKIYKMAVERINIYKSLIYLSFSRHVLKRYFKYLSYIKILHKKYDFLLLINKCSVFFCIYFFIL